MGALLARVWPYLAAIGIILGGVWFIYHKGEQAADARAKAEQAAIEKKLDGIKTDLEHTLQDGMQAIGRDVNNELAGHATVARTEVQPVILKEIQNGAPRLRDPAAGLTPGMFSAIERARRLSDPAPAGRPDGSRVPAPSPAR